MYEGIYSALIRSLRIFVDILTLYVYSFSLISKMTIVLL